MDGELQPAAGGVSRRVRRRTARDRRPRGPDHLPGQGVLLRARRDEARPRQLLPRASPSRSCGRCGGRPVLMQRFPHGRRRPVVLPEARSRQRARVARDDDRVARRTARRRGRSSPPTSRTSPGRSTSAASASTCGRTSRPTPSTPTSCASTSIRSRAPTSRTCARRRAETEVPARRARHRRLPEDDRQPRHPRVRAARAALGLVPGARRGRGRRARARAPPPRSASPRSGGRRSAASAIFVDFNQNAPHKTVFGAWCVRARAGRAGVDAAPLGRARRDPPRRRSRSQSVPAPHRGRRRSVGGHERRPAVARAAPRAARARPRRTG